MRVTPNKTYGDDVDDGDREMPVSLVLVVIVDRSSRRSSRRLTVDRAVVTSTRTMLMMVSSPIGDVSCDNESPEPWSPPLTSASCTSSWSYHRLAMSSSPSQQQQQQQQQHHHHQHHHHHHCRCRRHRHHPHHRHHYHHHHPMCCAVGVSPTSRTSNDIISSWHDRRPWHHHLQQYHPGRSS